MIIHIHWAARLATIQNGWRLLPMANPRPFASCAFASAGIAAALSRQGFALESIALLLPNEPNTSNLCTRAPAGRDSGAVEHTPFDRGNRSHLADSGPHGLIRHSSLPVPTVKIPWQRVLDQEPLDVPGDSYPEAIYDRARYWLSSTPVEQPATPKALS